MNIYKEIQYSESSYLQQLNSIKNKLHHLKLKSDSIELKYKLKDLFVQKETEYKSYAKLQQEDNDLQYLKQAKAKQANSRKSQRYPHVYEQSSSSNNSSPQNYSRLKRSGSVDTQLRSTNNSPSVKPQHISKKRLTASNRSNSYDISTGPSNYYKSMLNRSSYSRVSTTESKTDDVDLPTKTRKSRYQPIKRSFRKFYVESKVFDDDDNDDIDDDEYDREEKEQHDDDDDDIDDDEDLYHSSSKNRRIRNEDIEEKDCDDDNEYDFQPSKFKQSNSYRFNSIKYSENAENSRYNKNNVSYSPPQSSTPRKSSSKTKKIKKKVSFSDAKDAVITVDVFGSPARKATPGVDDYFVQGRRRKVFAKKSGLNVYTYCLREEAAEVLQRFVRDYVVKKDKSPKLSYNVARRSLYLNVSNASISNHF